MCSVSCLCVCVFVCVSKLTWRVSFAFGHRHAALVDVCEHASLHTVDGVRNPSEECVVCVAISFMRVCVCVCA